MGFENDICHKYYMHRHSQGIEEGMDGWENHVACKI